jgi:dTDP-4-dehydrorhamnose reductase
VARANPRHAIVRTAWLYGEGNNFIRTMLKLAGTKDEVAVVDDQTGAPTCTEDLAKAILALVRGDHQRIFHATCHGACTWHALAGRIFARPASGAVRAITTGELARPARRPRYSKLENFMLGLAGIDPFRPWEVALDAWLEGPGREHVEAARAARGGK